MLQGIPKQHKNFKKSLLKNKNKIILKEKMEINVKYVEGMHTENNKTS
jgi:hypothetical protein